MSSQSAQNAQPPPAPVSHQKSGSSIVLKSLSVLLGLFFIFIGAMKLTPHLSKDLHKDLVSEWMLRVRCNAIDFSNPSHARSRGETQATRPLQGFTMPSPIQGKCLGAECQMELHILQAVAMRLSALTHTGSRGRASADFHSSFSNSLRRLTAKY